jgi:hypothetical protein
MERVMGYPAMLHSGMWPISLLAAGMSGEWREEFNPDGDQSIDRLASIVRDHHRILFGTLPSPDMGRWRDQSSWAARQYMRRRIEGRFVQFDRAVSVIAIHKAETMARLVGFQTYLEELLERSTGLAEALSESGAGESASSVSWGHTTGTSSDEGGGSGNSAATLRPGEAALAISIATASALTDLARVRADAPGLTLDDVMTLRARLSTALSARRLAIESSDSGSVWRT